MARRAGCDHFEPIEATRSRSVEAATEKSSRDNSATEIPGWETGWGAISELAAEPAFEPRLGTLVVYYRADSFSRLH